MIYFFNFSIPLQIFLKIIISNPPFFSFFKLTIDIYIQLIVTKFAYKSNFKYTAIKTKIS